MKGKGKAGERRPWGRKPVLQWICAGLRHGPRDSAGEKLPYGVGVLLPFARQIFSHLLVHHKIQAHLNMSPVSKVYSGPVPLEALRANWGVHTYGATPATVGSIPLYKAANPPSFLYMLNIVAHMPGSSFGFDPSSANDADWIESRVRTMSRGYVNVTEVMPAIPPQVKRMRGVRSAPGYFSKKVYSYLRVSFSH